MKRSILAMIAFTFLFTACSGTYDDQVRNSYLTEGWITDSTYRIIASGRANVTFTESDERRESARNEAIQRAQEAVLEKFKEYSRNHSAKMDFKMTGYALAREIEGIIKGGYVRKATYGMEDNCEIIYDVKGKNLKEKVAAAQWE